MIQFALAALCATAAPTGSADAGQKTSASPVTAKHPLHVTADRLHIEGKKQQALWSGHVKAKRGTTNITCDRMIAFYTQDQEVTRVDCRGNVEVIDQDKWAKGDHADFDNVTGILIVTGNPEAKQGANHVRGTKVTFSVDQDTIEVDNATAILKKPPEGAAGPPAEGKKDKKEKTAR